MYKKIFFSIAIVFLFTVSANIVSAQECNDAEVTVIARDSGGKFIPNINFEIYEQVADVDGNPKPGKKVIGGKIDELLGKDTVSFSPDGINYVLKMWDKSSGVGEFWFYNELVLGCGSVMEITEVLSAVRVAFYDAEGILQKNVDFSVYTQRLDIDGLPINERDDLVYSADTSEEGEYVLYLASTVDSLDGKSDGIYLIEAESSKNKFVKYDIEITQGDTKNINYVFSDIKFTLRDVNGVFYPSGSKIEIYEQAYDLNNGKILGDKIGSIYTDDKGAATFEYPEGLYAAQIKGDGDQYKNFWELEINEEERGYYNLQTGVNWIAAKGSCETKSIFKIITKKYNGDLIAGLGFGLYEQTINADGYPEADKKITLQKINELGIGEYEFNPDPRKKYVLNIYDKNSKVGDFWYYNEIQFTCGANKTITKYIPALNITIRDIEGELKKEQDISIYTQKYDVDDKYIRETKDLVVNSLSTGKTGEATIYLAPDHYYNKEKRGVYVMVTGGENEAVFEKYNININPNGDYDLFYVFSDLLIDLKKPDGSPLIEKQIGFYKQETNLIGDYSLGDKIDNFKTDTSGLVKIEYPKGTYAVVVDDDLGQDNIFWNIRIKDEKRTKKKLRLNLTKIKAVNSEGINVGGRVGVYKMIEDSEGLFYKDKRIKSISVKANEVSSLIIAEGPYLFIISEDGKNYGEAVYIENGKTQNVSLSINSNNEIVEGQKFSLAKPDRTSEIAVRLSGLILLQVEQTGEAWYVYPETKKRYYMKDGDMAYSMMRDFGLGITNNDLKKIPIGFDNRFNKIDADSDGLSDKIEEALGTNPNDADSDNDGYVDGVEVQYGYNPNGAGMMNIDKETVKKVAGRIVLQVESRGEAWYINPADNKRYYMQDGKQAYEIMRFLSLGITDDNLDEIEEG